MALLLQLYHAGMVVVDVRLLFLCLGLGLEDNCVTERVVRLKKLWPCRGHGRVRRCCRHSGGQCCCVVDIVDTMDATVIAVIPSQESQS